MEKNPNVTIQINGHVNAPRQKNTHGAQKMSTERAKALRDYLIENEIPKKRVKYKGFGNTQMIYPIPNSHEEERANRRVEIEILKI